MERIDKIKVFLWNMELFIVFDYDISLCMHLIFNIWFDVVFSVQFHRDSSDYYDLGIKFASKQKSANK